MSENTLIQLQFPSNQEIISIYCTENENLLEAMTRQGILYRSECGGRGTCGKCRLQVIEGTLEITIQDKTIFTNDELQQGCRLSCKAYPKSDCTVLLTNEYGTEFAVITENEIEQSKPTAQIRDELGGLLSEQQQDDSYVIGIDLGTTTLAVTLVGIPSRKVLRTYTGINSQRVYGADVISRIQASNEGKGEQLRDSIRRDLLKGILAIIKEEGIAKSTVKMVAISGNTTMGHLLMGYSCKTLGIYPFTPINNRTTEIKFQELFQPVSSELGEIRENISGLQDIPVILLPGISTFVGGDIVAGLLVCGFDQTKKPCLLIDLGTNGEMAIGNQDSILVSSTAAGPAFEGGNISCGVGSIPGAISHVQIEGNKLQHQTINGKPAIGICGTGVIDITSELLKAGFMDDTGLLIEDYFKNGYEITEEGYHFTQKDIRELQLAKAAIRAGLEILIYRYKITYQQIDTVYLAGGFGYRIDVEKAIHIGLLPEELQDKIKVIGNSSLAGAVQYLTNGDARDRVNRILAAAKEIHLSGDKDFNNLYIKYMSF